MNEARIFLSYRHEDTAGYARLLYDRISARFPDSVFLDVGIEAGRDFAEAIEKAVGSSAVLLAVIGKRWLAGGRNGLTRLHDPDDFVRLEIAASLARDMCVIPVILPGALLPRSEELPDLLRPLVRRQAFYFTEASFDLEVAQLIRALERELGALAAPPVIVSGMTSNQGWSLRFCVAEQHPREILYRFEGEPEFCSTGLQHGTRDPVTGLPVPRPAAEVGDLQGSRVIEVKYIDSYGNECGPYRLIFDVDKELVAATKEIIEIVPQWISFREYPPGRLLVYFSTLLCYKNAFREIRYSVDDESLSQRLAFTRHPSVSSPGISEDDEIYFQIPMSTRIVAVKLFYIDGTESPIRRFSIGRLHTEGR